MARKNNYKSFFELISICITIITIVLTFSYKFLVRVNNFKQWGNLFKSLAIYIPINFIIYLLFYRINEDIFYVSLIITTIIFSIYWNKKLSYIDTRLNASMWKERQWWWNLDGWQFEQEVAKIFRLNGYDAKVTKGSGDGGVDIILHKNGICSIVQCKHYQNPVPPEPVRALWGCKDDFNAQEVIIVASSGLTEMSAKFVQNKSNYIVLNLDDIIRMSNYEQNNKILKNRIGRKVDY